ncbi:MAG: hypothetical protein H6710_20105 [Myxococcales bacterium]|nr:hypothetical protein [Myxococcales bacterium]MCB9706186.1 hypothetical protein [Myxococcales bacterium]
MATSIRALASVVLSALVVAACGAAPADERSPAPTNATTPSEASEPTPIETPPATPTPPAAAKPPRTGPPPPWTLPRTHHPAVRVFFSEDDRHLITAEAAGDLHVWNLERRGEPLMLAGHVAPVEHVAFAPEARLLASAASDGTLRLWFLEAGLALDPSTPDPERRRPEIPGPFNPPIPLDGVKKQVLALAFDPTARLVAAGSADGRAHLWSVDDPKEPLPPRNHGAPVHQVTFDAEGARLLTLARGRAPRVWAAAEATPATRLGEDRPRSNHVHGVFSRDGETIALLGAAGELEIWSAAGELRSRQEPGDGATPADATAIWSVFGALAADAPGALIWPREPDRRAYPWPVGARALIVDRGGARLLGADGSTRALRLEHALVDVAFAGDGLRVATVEEGGRVRVWRTGGATRPDR